MNGSLDETNHRLPGAGRARLRRAIKFYVETLGFVLIEDTLMESQNKRWVLVAPPGSTESRLLLARAVGWRDYRRYRERGVAVFQDLYGNLWDLLQLRTP